MSVSDLPAIVNPRWRDHMILRYAIFIASEHGLPQTARDAISALMQPSPIPSRTVQSSICFNEAEGLCDILERLSSAEQCSPAARAIGVVEESLECLPCYSPGEGGYPFTQ